MGVSTFPTGICHSRGTVIAGSATSPVGPAVALEPNLPPFAIRHKGNFFDADRAGKPVVRPDVPAKGAAWSDHPIDRFLFAGMQRAQVSPAAPAEGQGG